MNSKKKRNVVLIIAAVVLVILVLPKVIWFDGTGNAKDAARSGARRDQGLTVRTHIVRKEKLDDRVLTVGTVLSNEEVEVRSQISGQIEKIYFREGGRVKKDDLLVKINDDELQAQLLRAESRQAIADEQARRQKQLFDKMFASEEEYNNAVNELNIVKAEAQLIRAQIKKTEIRAPFDGRIGLRHVSEGSTVSPATVITTLQDNSPVKIDFRIPEKYVGVVRIGNTITFRVEGKTRSFRGTIYSLDAKIDQGTRTLRVRAVAPNREGDLVPGAFANVEISMQEREMLTIPSYALVPELKGQRVFLYRAGVVEARSVEIGVRDDQRVEITEGLQAGDTLITSAILQLRPGMAVTLATSQGHDDQ